MKVSIKKQSNILSLLEEGTVVLREITKDGHFRYEVTYRVNPRLAIQRKAITVRIQASKKPHTYQPSRVFITSNPEQTTRNLLLWASTSRDQSRSQRSDVLFSYLSDITTKIPNNKTTELSRQRTSSKETIGGRAETIMSSTREVVSRLVSEASKENIVYPVLENNTSTSIIPKTTTRNPSVARAVSQGMVARGIDPAQVSGKRTRTIQSAKKVSGGIISQPGRPKYILTDTETVSLLGGLGNEVNPENHLLLQATDQINVAVIRTQTTVDVQEILDIPAELLQVDEFYFVLSLMDNTGIEVQTISTTVPHTSNVANLKIPAIPPRMEVLQTGIPGKNVVQVKQVDPSATGVAIYRKEFRKDVPITDAAFTFIGNIECKATQDFQRMEDVVNNFNSILYRAIPYNDNGVLAAEFASAGSTPVRVSQRQKFNKRRNFVSIAGEVVDGGVYIELRDIPPGVSLVKLYRRDLTIHEVEFTLISNPNLIANEETLSPISITDGSTRLGRIYEYQVRLVYPSGDTETGSSNLVIEYNPVTANIVDTVVSSPTTVQEGADMDVRFTLQSSLVSADLDFIKSALETQGLSQFYADAISEERHNLQNIIAYGISRTNLTTSEVESFGITTSKEFSDRLLGSVRGVKPVQGGHEYRYTVTTFFRAAETTLSSVERTVATRGSTSYVLQPSRWLHPITLRQGTLVTASSLKRNHAQTPFSFGSVGNIVTTTVSLADTLPSILEARVQKVGRKATLVQWRTQGNVQKFDHFIVVLEMVGMRTVVGKCHNISETNYFQFVDILDNGERGNLTYYIVPVYYDFSRGTEIATNEVLF